MAINARYAVYPIPAAKFSKEITVISKYILLPIKASTENPRVAKAWNTPNIINELYRPILNDIKPPKNAPINVANNPKIFTTVPISVFENPIATEILPKTPFYKAEQEHQSFFEMNNQHPYCQAIISPKINKFIKKYKKLIKRI